ncbi:MAG: hypothetical protein MI976_12210 [Pseudomonadales bacterium]|nr:hypothetical protein [Pseudomonadales bacterium]
MSNIMIKHFSRLGVTLAGLLLLVNHSLAADTMTQEIPLNLGWNAVFLHVNPDDNNDQTLDDRKPENVFSHPNIARVWTLADTEDVAQFPSTPSEIGFNDPSWRVYVPEAFEESILTNLYAAVPGRVYLVKVINAAFILSVAGTPHYKDINWQPNRYNFVGFYADPDQATSFADFLNISGSDVKVYGLSSTTDEWQELNLLSNIEANKGYWIFNDGSVNQTSPLLLQNAKQNSFDFRPEVSIKNFAIGNRTGGSLDQVSFDLGTLQLQVFTGYDNNDGITPLWPPLSGYSTNIASGSDEVLLLGVNRTGLIDTTTDILTVTGMGAKISIPVAVDPLAPNTGLWAGVVNLTETTHVNSTAADKIEKVAYPLQLKLIIHIDDADNVSLLKQVYIVADNVTDELVLVTDDAHLDSFKGLSLLRSEAVGYRLSSSVYDFEGSYLPLNGSIETGLSGNLAIGSNLPTHPFKHRMHVHHDDKDNFTGEEIVSNNTFYDEVWPISRQINLTIDNQFNPQPENGMGQLVGVYQETISGIHKQDIVVRGRFLLQRISTIGALNPVE